MGVQQGKKFLKQQGEPEHSELNKGTKLLKLASWCCLGLSEKWQTPVGAGPELFLHFTHTFPATIRFYHSPSSLPILITSLLYTYFITKLTLLCRKKEIPLYFPFRSHEFSCTSGNYSWDGVLCHNRLHFPDKEISNTFEKVCCTSFPREKLIWCL